MSWQQLFGANGLNQGAGAVAPFDIEAAPMGPGINVGQDYTLNSLTHNYNFTPAQAALPQLTDLGNDYGMNDNWYSLFGTAAQGPGCGPLSPAQMSPVSDYSMGEASDSNSSLSSHMDVSEGSSDEYEDLFSGASMAKPAFLDD
jgi:hypothetical protein